MLHRPRRRNGGADDLGISQVHPSRRQLRFGGGQDCYRHVEAALASRAVVPTSPAGPRDQCALPRSCHDGRGAYRFETGRRPSPPCAPLPPEGGPDRARWCRGAGRRRRLRPRSPGSSPATRSRDRGSSAGAPARTTSAPSATRSPCPVISPPRSPAASMAASIPALSPPRPPRGNRSARPRKPAAWRCHRRAGGEGTTIASRRRLRGPARRPPPARRHGEPPAPRPQGGAPRSHRRPRPSPRRAHPRRTRIRPQIEWDPGDESEAIDAAEQAGPIDPSRRQVATASSRRWRRWAEISRLPSDSTTAASSCPTPDIATFPIVNGGEFGANLCEIASAMHHGPTELLEAGTDAGNVELPGWCRQVGTGFTACDNGGTSGPPTGSPAATTSSARSRSREARSVVPRRGAGCDLQLTAGCRAGGGPFGHDLACCRLPSMRSWTWSRSSLSWMPSV